MAQYWFKGTGAPAFAPTKYGQTYVDTANGKIYKSKGISSSADWVEFLMGPIAFPVTTVFGRAGAVVAQTGDYNAAQVGADPAGSSATVQSNLNSHTVNSSNPHGTTKAQVGLGNVQNLDQTNPSNIIQDATHRFATDSEKSIWNSKQDSLGFTPENTSNKGIANGYASLDSGGKVPSSQLPSFVDDVLEYSGLASFPGTGESGKIYTDLSNGKIYRWSGSTYVEISPSPGSTDSVPEGSTNFYFAAARVLSTILSGLSIATSSTITSTDSVLAAFGKLQAQLNNLLGTVLTGLAVGSNSAISATDSILQAFGKIQAQLNAKEPAIGAGTNAQYWRGDKSWQSLNSDVLAQLLNGFALGSDATVAATDTILQAFGKIQAQINVWIELFMTAAVSSTSNVTLTNLTELQIPVVAGKKYRIEGMLLFRSAATTTGITLSMGNSGAAGTLALVASVMTGADGTGTTYAGSITSFGDTVVSTGVPAANTDYVAMVQGIFVCTTSGTLIPQFRSEVLLSQVTVQPGSNFIAREFT